MGFRGRVRGALHALFGLTHAPPPVVVATVFPAPVLVVPEVILPPVVVPQVVLPPVVVVPQVTAAAVVEAPAPAAEEPAPRMPRLALKWAPVGWSSSGPLDAGTHPALSRAVGSVGLEFRFSTRWSLRSDLQYGASGRLWDVAGFKLALFPWSRLRPYGSLGVSGHTTDLTSFGQKIGTRLNLGLVGALGLDLNLGRHFFLEAEGRYRVERPGCCQEVPLVSALVGGGVAF
ncbi:MAG: hypothetical protein ACYC8T_07385 [Myxococcaceae bacterium]